AQPHGIAVIGADAAGQQVEALARSCLAPVGGTAELLRGVTSATTIKDRFIAGGQQLLRADRDPQQGLDAATAARVEAAALAAVGEAAVVVLSDYGKGLLSDALIAAVIAAAARLGRPLV